MSFPKPNGSNEDHLHELIEINENSDQIQKLVQKENLKINVTKEVMDKLILLVEKVKSKN